MAGEMEIVFSLSARIHVLLRRETKRITDVEWMIVNADYANEILNVCRATEHAELVELTQRIEKVHPLFLKSKSSPPKQAGKILEEVAAKAKYLHTLR